MAYFNSTYRRTGTLWEGRYKACLVDSERYLLTCYRYIELNPVRAAMVVAPADYRWSSYGCNAMGQSDPLITTHACYVELGDVAPTREAAYRELCAEAIGREELQSIRDHVQRQRALGDPRFQSAMEQFAGRCASLRPRGRPRLLDAGSAEV